MSFGFSVGDFITVAEYVDKVISCLKDSRSEYQRLMSSFHVLELTFMEFSRFPYTEGHMHTYPRLRCILLTCEKMLTEFLITMDKKYKLSLGLSNSAGTVKDAVKKVDFGFRKKEDAAQLLGLLQVQVEAINTLLNIQGL